MPNLSRSRVRQLAAATSVMAAVGLVACSTPEQSAEPAEQTTAQSAAETTTALTSSVAKTSTVEESSTSETTSTSPSAKPSKKGVDEAREVFSSLAPASLWKSFDSCSTTGLEGSYECAGSEVGSFQFFDSRSKAASTTQLLTELRSSQVISDTGRFVVGWSTLGTTAVITVVDNDAGQVMQQLVSSDIEDPDDKIADLGLTDPPFDSGKVRTAETTESVEPAAEAG